jgi:hypothetical protein
MPLKPISTEAGARDLLKRLIESGRCTIEDFDAAPPGHINPQAYRNLLRDVAADPKIEVTDPRDFMPDEPALPF